MEDDDTSLSPAALAALNAFLADTTLQAQVSLLSLFFTQPTRPKSKSNPFVHNLGFLMREKLTTQSIASLNTGKRGMSRNPLNKVL